MNYIHKFPCDTKPADEFISQCADYFYANYNVSRNATLIGEWDQATREYIIQLKIDEPIWWEDA